MSNWNLPAKGGHMEAQDGIYYQNMTTKMVEERLKKNDVILIPVGSTENHGPSAPYGEDTYLCASWLPSGRGARWRSRSGTARTHTTTWGRRGQS